MAITNRVSQLLRHLEQIHPERRWPLLVRFGPRLPLVQEYLATHPEKRRPFLLALLRGLAVREKGRTVSG